MSRSTHKLRRALNGGYKKAFKEKFHESPDLHAKILNDEIDYDGLAKIFLSNPSTIQFFKKIGILKVNRRDKSKKALFIKSEAIKSLEPFVSEGRLTTRKTAFLKKKTK